MLMGWTMHGGFSDSSVAETAGGVLTIDLNALTANYRRLQGRLALSVAGAVVKADAYGLGALKVVPALAAAGCHNFFVAHLCEALELRPVVSGAARLFVLNGLLPGAEEACAGTGIVPVLNSLDQVSRWAAVAARRGETLPAVLQFDTGMSRLGMSEEEAKILAAEPTRLNRLRVLFVMSHLASAD